MALVRHGGDRRSGDFKWSIDHLNRTMTGNLVQICTKSQDEAAESLNESQRSMVAARMANLRQGQPKEKPANLPVSQPEAAESLNVSERSVRSARKVIDLGLPALARIVEQGQMPVSTAAAVAERNKACNHLVFRLNVLDDSALPR